MTILLTVLKILGIIVLALLILLLAALILAAAFICVFLRTFFSKKKEKEA